MQLVFEGKLRILSEPVAGASDPAILFLFSWVLRGTLRQRGTQIEHKAFLAERQQHPIHSYPRDVPTGTKKQPFHFDRSSEQ